LEYIIIDGGSKDETLQIVGKYKDKIAYIVSEKDAGIYDAMNKGIRAAKGDYLWFINSGDEIYEPDTVSKMLSLSSDADVYYGKTSLLDKDLSQTKVTSTPAKLN
jgi:glycosyltransferase involved in cell wall biosynthesis